MDTQEQMTMKMIKMENNYYNNHMNMNILSDSDPVSSSLPVGSNYEVNQKSSLGFMELLGFQDFYSSISSSIFENTTPYDHHQLPPPSSASLSMDQHRILLNQEDDEEEDLTVDEGGEEESLSSVVLNVQSPNSCSISSPPANQQLLHKSPKQCNMKEKKTMDGDEPKTKKKKKEKEARFAFLTRSEIDQLDDGYRWRKYGQKAVKNSHFPRSYYRCTSVSCNVKKRVERCMDDPSYVVTTYEGHHIHPVTANSAPSFNRLTNPAHTAPPPAVLKLDQLPGGLLQDMLHYH